MQNKCTNLKTIRIRKLNDNDKKNVVCRKVYSDISLQFLNIIKIHRLVI